MMIMINNNQVDCGLFTPPRQMISHYVDSDQSDPNEDIEYILTLMDEITVELIEEGNIIYTVRLRCEFECCVRISCSCL